MEKETFQSNMKKEIWQSRQNSPTSGSQQQNGDISPGASPLQQPASVTMMFRKHPKFNQLRCDSFWEFLFSRHDVDKLRQKNFSRIVEVFDDYGGLRRKLKFPRLNEVYLRQFGRELDSKFLREIFSVQLFPRGQELEVFKRCGEVFRVHEENGNIEITIDELPQIMKNIFVSSAPILNAEQIRNIKLADKVFEIVPAQRKMNLVTLMEELVVTREYKDVKDKNPEAPHLEPIKFIGFLELYWGQVFKIIPDHETRQVWIKRHVLHHQKPSQDKKYMQEIMKELPSFPLPSNLLTTTHVVQVMPNMLPTDGIGMKLLSLHAEFDHVTEELRKYYKWVMELKDKDERKSKRLHPNDTYDGTCCLRTFTEDGQSEVFRRCRITGQSYGLAMVQDADFAWQGLVEVKTLYTIPRHLLGVLQTCVYGVLPGFRVNSENEIIQWKSTTKLMKREDVRCIAKFLGEAERTEYSGRRKHTIYKVLININKMGISMPLQTLPLCYDDLPELANEAENA